MSPSTPDTMRASVLTAARSLEIQQRPVPTPAGDEVLIKVSAVGICGSDVHFYQDGQLGDWTVREPLVLGHEAAGQIVAVGADVAEGRIGERVAIEPQHPCPTSPETLGGRYNLDPHMRFYAVPGVDGAFQEYVTIQAHFAFPVPETISDDAAALMEPLSVAIAAARKAELTVGARVHIAGAGPIGLLMAQVARAYGAREILVSDIAAGRRTAALRFGATDVLDPAQQEPPARSVDTFIDASGANPAVTAGIGAVRPAGRVVLVGMGAKEMTLPVSTIMDREIVLTGVFRYTNTWPTAIGMAVDGIVDLDAMVTGHYGLADVAAALDSTSAPGTLKSIVNPAG